MTGIDAELHVVTDGQEAVEFLDAADGSEVAPCPCLIILDINLPKLTGAEVLRHIRRSLKCAHVPVLMVSTSGSVTDREEMSGLGCDDYFQKPSEYEDFMKLGDVVKALLGRS